VRSPATWEGKGEVTRVVALLRAEGGEEGPQGLEAAEDGRAAEADEVVLVLSSNETLVVDVTGGIDSSRVAVIRERERERERAREREREREREVGEGRKR